MIDTKADSRREVLYFVHVPKCAGTTVEHHFVKNLPREEVLRPKKSTPVLRYLQGRAWSPPSDFDPARVRVLAGHFFGRATGALLPQHTPLEAILIRDPVGLYLSWYNYRMTRHQGWGRRIPSFQSWYRSQGRNPVARHLLTRHLGWSELKFVLASADDIVAEACQALDSFWFVGAYHHVDALLAAASERFGVPPQGPRRNITQYKFLTREQMDDVLWAQLTAENAIDQHLWDRYKDRMFDQDAAQTVAAPRAGRLAADEMRRLVARTSSMLKRA